MSRFVKKVPKFWNMKAGKWETAWIYFGWIRIAKLELARGYPCKSYIVDKWYKICIHLCITF